MRIDTFKEPLQENHRGNVKAPGFVGVLHDEVNLKLIMSPVGLLTDTTQSFNYVNKMTFLSNFH